MNLFTHAQIDFAALRRGAYNLRWAEVEEGVIPLTAADSDFPAPEPVRAALARVLHTGYLNYAPAAGLPEFREAAAAHYAARDGIQLSAERIVAVDSAASGMVALARTYLSPGDEMLVWDPVDFLFGHAATSAGATVVRVPFARTGPLDLEAWERAITPRTRMIGVCQPHNPFGRVLTRAELERILELAERHNLWVLSDEIWSDIVHPPHQHTAFLALGERARPRTLLVHGLSKSYGLAGLRIGFVALPDAQAAQRFIEASGALYTSFGATTLSQYAAIAAWRDCGAWLAEWKVHLTAQRDLAVAHLARLPGVELTAPQATFVVFPRVVGTGWEPEALVAHLRREARVATVPGSPRWFGPGAAGHIRLALATSRDVLQEALGRIEQAWPVARK